MLDKCCRLNRKDLMQVELTSIYYDLRLPCLSHCAGDDAVQNLFRSRQQVNGVANQMFRQMAANSVQIVIACVLCEWF